MCVSTHVTQSSLNPIGFISAVAHHENNLAAHYVQYWLYSVNLLFAQCVSTKQPTSGAVANAKGCEQGLPAGTRLMYLLHVPGK